MAVSSLIPPSPSAITRGWLLFIVLATGTTALVLCGVFPFSRISPPDRVLAPAVLRTAMVVAGTLLWPWLAASRSQWICSALLLAALACCAEVWAGSAAPWDVPVATLVRQYGPWVAVGMWLAAGRAAAGVAGAAGGQSVTAARGFFLLSVAICGGAAMLSYVLAELAGDRDRAGDGTATADLVTTLRGGPWVWAGGWSENSAAFLAAVSVLLIAVCHWPLIRARLLGRRRPR